MTYLEFKTKVQRFPVILSRDLVRLAKNAQPLRNQLTRWKKRGLLIQLKRGTYLLNESDRKIAPSRVFLANQLYGPSYVSLEYALQTYGLIPERVADVTSITTKKTMRLKNSLGTFTYQHIQPSAFRGFKTSADESGLTVFIAEPEKAVVDFLYLNLSRFPATASDIFTGSFRFQNLKTLKSRRLVELAELFNNHKLVKVVQNFCKLIKK